MKISYLAIAFLLLSSAPLSHGVYCFASVRDPVKQLCQELQEGNDVMTEEECCALSNTTDGGGGFVVSRNETLNLTDDGWYQCEICKPVQTTANDSWSVWSACSVTCGAGGIRTRSRACTPDETDPQNNGTCSPRSISEPCHNLPPCQPPSEKMVDDPYAIALIFVVILLMAVIGSFVLFCWYVRHKKKLREKKALISHLLPYPRKSAGTMSSSSMIFHSAEDHEHGVSDDCLTPIPLPSPTGEVQRRIIPSILYREDSEMTFVCDDATDNNSETKIVNQYVTVK